MLDAFLAVATLAFSASPIPLMYFLRRRREPDHQLQRTREHLLEVRKCPKSVEAYLDSYVPELHGTPRTMIYAGQGETVERFVHQKTRPRRLTLLH